jgi:4-hydroxyphenylpyruvate dioxygenase
MVKDENQQEYQRGGCGGFAKGNVSELIKDIEDNNNKTIDAPASQA